MKALSLLLLTLFGGSVFSLAQNPIIKDQGVSDPHVRVFNDTVYLFSGHDSNPDDKTWVMPNWQVFSTTDLVNWKREAIISPTDNYMENNSTDCWASDAATRNGKYYFYFSDRKRGIGVMQAEHPAGPYIDALGKPLVAPMHDPTIFADNDRNNTSFLIYGDKEGGGYRIAKLNENMIELAEEPKTIEIIGKEWDEAPEWMDKNYLFKHQGIYYLSWGRDYAISENIYGPYRCEGAVGEGHNLSEFAHGSFFWWKGQFYHIWCYYIRPGFKYRETIISYCHFNTEGKVITDTRFLDKHKEYGVGRYNASWQKIEAEWFYEKASEMKKQESDEEGFEMLTTTSNGWLLFANVDFSERVNTFKARVSGNVAKGEIEVRLNSLSGPLLGKITISDKNTYETVSCSIPEVSGKQNVYLKFVGQPNSQVKLDWFSFSE